MRQIQEIVNTQLEANRQGLAWSRAYLKGTQLTDTRQKLIQNRINLKRIGKAHSVKPAAAVFGESQVGKSYMVDCLLTSESSVLNVYDGKGNATGFLEYVNPIGGGKEATSLISRFTIDRVWVNDDFPIRVELLSPIDVVMVIIDTYFNDVMNHQLPKRQDIEAEIDNLIKLYKGKPTCQSVVTEDEIYELKEYFTMSLMVRGESFRESLLETGYFENLAQLIPSIPISSWPEVFGFLWNREQQLTDVFSLLMKCHESLDFSNTVYIKLDAVLRSQGTILHVDRMYELFGLSSCQNDKGETITIVPAKVPNMDVLTETGRIVPSVSKSAFCAIAMEVDFSIIQNPRDPHTPIEEFKTEGIVKEKPFLKTLDILDFPGARSRKMLSAGSISKNDACEMMLRGKVAYLFNKYSQQYLISNLLFCHHEEKSEVATLSSLLKGWIDSTVGDTPEKRTTFMQNTDIPPLFLIGTKFNKDLMRTPDDSKGTSEDKLDVMRYRWTKRFGNLQNMLGQNESNNWMNEWELGKTFQNTYLLRSYEYSCQNGLFYGYQERENGNGDWKLVYKEDGTLQGELGISEDYVNFFKALEDTFIENDFVKKHFPNPMYSWESAIGSNENDKWHPQDGSDLIIENLTKSSRNMTKLRELQFTRIVNDTFDTLVKVLYDFYHDDNSDIELRKQINLAGSINLTLDVLFGKDKYFFSDFISALIIEEEHLHDVILDIINDLSVLEETDLSMLFALRAKAGINTDDSYEKNVERLKEAYNCTSDEDLETKLSAMGVKVEDIINPPKVMNFSHLIANTVENAWFESNLTLERYSDFVNRGLNQVLLQNLFSNLKALYVEKVNLSERIARRIHQYVSAATGSLDDMSDMLADICSEMINKFVNTVGSAYYDDETWNDIEQTVKHNGFDLPALRLNHMEIEVDEDSVRNSLPEVFDSFDNIDKILNQIPVDTSRLAHFSNYQEYRNWVECMKLSFLATAGIPKYDVNMNNALRVVLLENIVRPEPLQHLVETNSILKSLSTLQ